MINYKTIKKCALSSLLFAASTATTLGCSQIQSKYLEKYENHKLESNNLEKTPNENLERILVREENRNIKQSEIDFKIPKETYTINKDDSLSKIGMNHRFYSGYNPALIGKLIAKQNNIENPNLIFPGQKIELSNPNSIKVKVKEGDYLIKKIREIYDVEKFDGSLHELTLLIAYINKIDNPNLIKTGDSLNMPSMNFLNSKYENKKSMESIAAYQNKKFQLAKQNFAKPSQLIAKTQIRAGLEQNNSEILARIRKIRTEIRRNDPDFPTIGEAKKGDNLVELVNGIYRPKNSHELERKCNITANLTEIKDIRNGELLRDASFPFFTEGKIKELDKNLSEEKNPQACPKDQIMSKIKNREVSLSTIHNTIKEVLGDNIMEEVMLQSKVKGGSPIRHLTNDESRRLLTALS